MNRRGHRKPPEDCRDVQAAPGGEPVALEVRIANQSTIVDAYVVEAPEAPPWLQVRTAEVRLLPNTDKAVRLLVHIPGDSTVAAHQTGLAIRVRSVTDASVRYDDVVRLAVLAIDVPITLRLKPSLLRVRDCETGQLQLVADNRRSNRPLRVFFAGQDPERVVRFTFSPPALDVPAGHITSAHVRVDAPHPEPGKEATRQLTVSASDGQRAVEASATFVQTSSPPVVDVPVKLQLGPSLIRVRDRGSGWSPDGQRVAEAAGTFVPTSSDRRPIARVLLTLLGGLAMILGAFTPWTANPRLDGVDWT